jgi:BirA family transcriptional regulator, biotin operon repressor / biotin---[acetyl-CoA-carboxylase] ligase
MPQLEIKSISDARTPLRLEKVSDGLDANRLGTKFHYFEEVASTNSIARDLAERGAGEGEIVVAEAQTAGRGRLGRQWVSPPLANLYLSIILRPKLPPVHVPQITLMAAVALAETTAAFISDFAAIKWPNDIMVGDKKLAGILTELSCDAGRVHYAILGIGANLNFPVEIMPEAIRRRATSVLALTGQSVSRESFLRRLIQDLDRCYGVLEASGFDAIAARWAARFELRGRRVRVELLGQEIIGRAKGIDAEGALLVEDESGALQRIIAGDIFPAED